MSTSEAIMMGKPLKILFIADNNENSKLAKPELVRAGFNITSKRVETNQKINKALAAEDWDVIISDYHMLNFNAVDALKTLHENGKEIPFIVLSVTMNADDAIHLLRHGAHDCIHEETLTQLAPAVERELREATNRIQRHQDEEHINTLSTAIEQSPVSIAITDREGKITYINPKFEDVTGYPSAEVIGRGIDFTLQDKTGQSSFLDAWNTINKGKEWSGEFCNIRHDGQLFWEFVKVSPITDKNGAITNFIVIKEDISTRRRVEEQLLRQAHYDDLTGLPNRNLMINRLDLAIEESIRNDKPGALICIDLDRFKDVNDTLGHDFGDELLKEAAFRLRACIRRFDTLTRMGGDEFVIILPEICDSDDAQHLAERVIEAFNQPFTIDGQNHLITATAGLVLFPENGNDPQTLLRNSDVAMNKAKDLGRNRYQFFTEEINSSLIQRLDMETRLRGAVSRGEMILFYQPIIDMQTNLPVAYEALIRWQQDDGTICMPNDFIPLAEDVGLIQEIGNWVIATACSELSTILTNPVQPSRISVNVSPKQLQTTGFAEYVENQLHLNNLKPKHLELEITERVLVDDTQETHQNLSVLCALGVSLSIDDFGTGYSSLRYLQKYPFQTLKIDRSFISDAANNLNSARLVETIIAMAHGLGLSVIAEGVETTEQHSFLSSRVDICNQAQGFLFGHPTPVINLPNNKPDTPTKQ